MKLGIIDRLMSWSVFSLAAYAMFSALACAPGTPAGTRQPGEALVLRGQVPVAARAGEGSRSIAGAVSGIASLPIVAGWPQIDNAGTVPVDAGGAFSMELAP